MLGLLGVGAILNVVLGLFMEPMTWGGLLGFSLLMGALSVWRAPGSSSGGSGRWGIVPLALGAFALLVIVGLMVRRPGVDLPAPSALPTLAFGVVAAVASVRASTWLGRQSR